MITGILCAAHVFPVCAGCCRYSERYTKLRSHRGQVFDNSTYHTSYHYFEVSYCYHYYYCYHIILSSYYHIIILSYHRPFLLPIDRRYLYSVWHHWFALTNKLLSRCELLDEEMVKIVNASNPSMTPWPEHTLLLYELTGNILSYIIESCALIDQYKLTLSKWLMHRLTH